jgi:hypothetical protein
MTRILFPLKDAGDVLLHRRWPDPLTIREEEMIYRKQENVIFADFRKCRDALKGGPDSFTDLCGLVMASFALILIVTLAAYAVA